MREPDHVFLLGLRIRLWRVFGEAIEWYEAAVLRLEPATQMRRRRVTDISDRRAASSRRSRHAPTHHDQLGAGAGVTYDRGRVVRRDADHRRQIADVTVDDTKECNDRS